MFGIAFTKNGNLPPDDPIVGWKVDSSTGKTLLWATQEEALEANDLGGWTGYVRPYTEGCVYIIRRNDGQKRYIDAKTCAGTATSNARALRFFTRLEAWAFVLSCRVPENWIPVRLRRRSQLEEGAKVRTGFIVSFEERKNDLLYSKHFPDVHAGEAGIPTEEAAWARARWLYGTSAKDRIVNIYVCSAVDFRPVPGYRLRILNPYQR